MAPFYIITWLHFGSLLRERTHDMTLQEVLEIKVVKSQLTKDMTTAQLKTYYANSLQEFCKITGKRMNKKTEGLSPSALPLSAVHDNECSYLT